MKSESQYRATIAIVNNLNRVFIYDEFGFPKKVDGELTQTVDGVGDPRKGINEKTYTYQLAIIFKPLEY